MAKNRAFLWITIGAAFGIALGIYYGVFATAAPKSILHDLYTAGVLVIVLMACILITLAVITERTLSYRKSLGKGDLEGLLKKVRMEVEKSNINGAIELCVKHNSAVSSTIWNGLERYRSLDETEPRFSAKIAETQKAMEEAATFESAQYETNLTPLKTIASISTLIGLLGTVKGMITAFAKLSESGGSPDPSGLAGAISEALYNTAGGLMTSIMCQVAYNFFKAKIEDFTYTIDEVAFNIIQTLTLSRRNMLSERERQQ
jgi:biopolymer transport protein ExbB